MKSQQLFDRLKQKSCYEKFIKANPQAYLYAIFAMFSAEEKEGDKMQFDFLVEKTSDSLRHESSQAGDANCEQNRVAIAEYPFEEVKVSLQEINPKPKKLELSEIVLDIEDIPEEIKKIQKEKKDKTNITKTIAILKEGVWDLNCLTNTVDILKIKIDAKTKECLNFKKESLMNFIQFKKIKKD